MDHSYHVFLSYARPDTHLMQPIRDYLRNNELIVWTDEGIEPGTSQWVSAIENAIKQSGTVVVLLSPDSCKSKWVDREIAFAEEHNVQIIPMLVLGETTDSLPLRLISHQRIDARQDVDGAVQRLFNTIRKHLRISSDLQIVSDYKMVTLGEDVFPSDILKKYDVLGDRTKQILLHINEYKTQFDRYPTVREIAQHVQLGSTNTVSYHLNKLENKGFLEQDEKLARGIIVVKPFPKYHVYLSSSITDQKRANQIEKRLKSKGLRVCTSEPSDRLSRVQAEIRNSCCVISILSPHAKLSTTVLSHLICAQENQTAIIPLLVSGTPIDSIPTTLPEKFYDIRESFDSELEIFIDAVLGYLGRLI